MPKALYLVMRINDRLKARLRRLAYEDGSNLSSFVTTELNKVLALCNSRNTSRLTRRRLGRIYFMMRINKELKTELERLAAEDYRTLTDFLEIALHDVITTSQASRPFSPSAVNKNALALQPKLRRGQIAFSITPIVKAELQRLADRDYRPLTNFIELKLFQMVATRQSTRAGDLPRRQSRRDRLTVRISNEFKVRLQTLADQEFRTITDFVEIRLRQIIASRQGWRGRRRCSGPDVGGRPRRTG